MPPWEPVFSKKDKKPELVHSAQSHISLIGSVRRDIGVPSCGGEGGLPYFVRPDDVISGQSLMAWD